MAKAIMIQGTMSNAGKSFLVAGLCRILKQDGYKVAPFKSQNMALNSFITEDGLEMGRAQVMQAEAAGIKPDVSMNPILLKPTTDTGSQVIVNGKPLSNMPAVQYFKFKKELIPEIKKAYAKLDEAYDIIVIEGAGSPAEINLKSEDIVNMGIAKMMKAPVLLAGDIDRGGVFAQLYGTVMLLEKEERDLVKGLIINKFRGDKRILDPGPAMIADLTGVPVVGVVPYMKVDIEDEDSLSERLEKTAVTAPVDIAVIRLPRISNFTDINALEAVDGVSVRFAGNAKELGEPDLIVIPGTKSTISDLKWLRQNGLEAAIKKKAAAGTLVFGICGGYQMLGESVSDPDGMEGGGNIRGMELLPVRTVFAGEKKRTRVIGEILPVTGAFAGLGGVKITGYEIHMGVSTPAEEMKETSGFVRVSLMENGSGGTVGNGESRADGDGCADGRDGTESGSGENSADRIGGGADGRNGTESGSGKGEWPDGCVRDNVCGCYIHGIFDSDEMRQALRRLLYRKKGLDNPDGAIMSFAQYKEMQYDELARILRENLDMKKIYEILEQGAV